MMLPAILLAVFAVVSTAEQVPCITGKNKCDGSPNMSLLNNNYFCCETGFNMQWNIENVNDSAVDTCICNRQSYVTDCIEGATECSGSSSISSDGVTIKCCKYGDSMNVVNSFINGVKVDSCKCSRGGIANINGAIRPMTEAERVKFASSMNQFSKDLQNSMSQMTQTLGQSLGLINPGVDRPPFRTAGGDNWASNFINEIGQTFRRRMYQPFGPSWIPVPRNNSLNGSRRAQVDEVSSPRPSWDIRQRRFQQLQRRLQQQQQQRQQSGAGQTFLNRLSRHPVIAQIMNPSWWVTQNWGTAFGPSRNQRNNVTQIVRSNSTNDGNTITTNMYSSLPPPNTNTTA